MENKLENWKVTVKLKYYETYIKFYEINDVNFKLAHV